MKAAASRGVCSSLCGSERRESVRMGQKRDLSEDKKRLVHSTMSSSVGSVSLTEGKTSSTSPVCHASSPVTSLAVAIHSTAVSKPRARGSL
jgi:hypothetical protein